MELFYVPDKSIYIKKKDVIAKESLEDLTKDWNLSEVYNSDNKSYGSLLSNDISWQNKWYLKFDPPKSASELGIEQYWSYEAPKLSNFAEATGFDVKSSESSKLSQLGKTSLSNLKNMATVILSGTTHESLKKECYRRETFKADSEADRASTISAQLKMPTNESSQTKLSILENFKMTASKSNKLKVSHKKKN